MRGRKPKPTRLHLLDGTFRADRHGPPPDPEAAHSTEAPRPPAHIKGTALRYWHQAVEDLRRLDMLDRADAGLIALYAEARAELSWAVYTIRKVGRLAQTKDGGIKAHPAVHIKNAAAIRAARFASELGLTPIARSRLKRGAGFGPLDDPDPEESDLD